MSKSERKAFEKRQKDAEEERFFDEMAFLMAFWDEQEAGDIVYQEKHEQEESG